MTKSKLFNEPSFLVSPKNEGGLIFGRRDDIVIEDAALMLAASNLFDDIYALKRPLDEPAPASESFAVAWLYGLGGKTEPTDMYKGSPIYEREASFEIVYEVRDLVIDDRSRRASMIESEIRNIFNRARFGGVCHTGKSRVGAIVQDETIMHPSARFTGQVSFGYSIFKGNDNDASNREIQKIG